MREAFGARLPIRTNSSRRFARDSGLFSTAEAPSLVALGDVLIIERSGNHKGRHLRVSLMGAGGRQVPQAQRAPAPAAARSGRLK
jgi:hypothetical protein